MIRPEKLFENFFNERAITTPRLAAFADDALIRFEQRDPEQFADVIAAISAARDIVRQELAEVATTLAGQKGETLTTDQVMENFKDDMVSGEVTIAFRLGKDTPAYLEFYPQGLTEYNQINKTQMPTITARVAAAAGKYIGVLTPAFANPLIAFAELWREARQQQSIKKGEVGANRSERNTGRDALEVALVKAVHVVGARHPAEVDTCMSYFAWQMLNVPRNSSLEDEDENPPV